MLRHGVVHVKSEMRKRFMCGGGHFNIMLLCQHHRVTMATS